MASCDPQRRLPALPQGGSSFQELLQRLGQEYDAVVGQLATLSERNKYLEGLSPSARHGSTGDVSLPGTITDADDVPGIGKAPTPLPPVSSAPRLNNTFSMGSGPLAEATKTSSSTVVVRGGARFHDADLMKDFDEEIEAVDEVHNKPSPLLDFKIRTKSFMSPASSHKEAAKLTWHPPALSKQTTRTTIKAPEKISSLFFGKIGRPRNGRLTVHDALRRSGFMVSEQQRCIINPEQSPFLARWDLIVVAALSFVAVIAPMQVAILPSDFGIIFYTSCLVDVTFFVDLILQFFIMYQKHSRFGVSMESGHWNIAKHYLRTWFIIDFVSIIPFDLASLLTNYDSVRNFRAVKVIRVLRILKLTRMLRAVRIFHHVELRMAVTYHKLALLKFFCILLIITHWLANLWALTLVLVEEGDTPRWIDRITANEDNVEVKTKDSSIKLYLTCLYFTSYTITSVGYGDISPVNIVETVIATVMIVIAGISWAIVLGQVCGIVAGLGKDEQEFRSTMDELNNMMRDRIMPPEVQRRLRSFFLSNKVAQRRARQNKIINCMSPGLQGEVVMITNRQWIKKVGLLNKVMRRAVTGAPDSAECTAFIVECALKLVSSAHAQKELFGAPYTLYILIRGLASGRGRIQHSGSVWGIDFMLSDGSLAEPFESQALTYVELTTLTRSDFLGLVDKYGAQTAELKKMVRQYCIRLALQRYIIKEAARRRRCSSRTTSFELTDHEHD